MNNNTRDDYKKAIRAKYEVEKEGEFSSYFLPTSQANLRNLCWLRFETNDSKDDLSIFFSVFDFDFDLSKSKHFAANTTDKFRPIVTFLKGEKELAHFNRVELAAILVDFHPRPFKKFNKEGRIEINQTIEEPHMPSENPYVPELIFINNGDDDGIEKENLIRIEKLKEERNSSEEENLDKTALPKEKESLIIDHGIPKEENVLKEVKTTEILKPVELFLGFESEPGKKKDGWIKRNKWVGTGILSFLGLLVYYYFAQKNECMQWSGDHYEEVSCDLEIQGIGTYNVVEPFDERIINLRKIKVCDTTTFFKNGEAIIWYTKVNDSVEFFNTHGRHPENKKPLRPVTKYIIDKYVKEGSCKLTDKKINDL